uniref:UDP-3-O-acyl-N-acetylglucosamine deacetylase n=1 Tax=Cucumis sativus TaxID=3659 RepID=A0A0A0KPR6_CUCSA
MNGTIPKEVLSSLDINFVTYAYLKNVAEIYIQVPIFDGSAGKWVDAIEEIGLKLAIDQCGNFCEKMAPHVNQPVHVWRNDCFLIAFPATEVRITYGIDFPQVPEIGCQWFFTAPLDNKFYAEQIAPSRTFCIYEEVEQMRNMGLIKGGSMENALVCSLIQYYKS